MIFTNNSCKIDKLDNLLLPVPDYLGGAMSPASCILKVHNWGGGGQYMPSRYKRNLKISVVRLKIVW